MINPDLFLECLKKHEITFYTGIPDSLLFNLCVSIDNDESIKHIVAANEGAAIALAAGHYLSSGKASLVYMQNSGLCNAMNPLLSLADKDIFGIPMLLVIGWRGEPGIKDEPQHLKQGKVTDKLLDTIGIPYRIISDASTDYDNIIKEACEHCIKNNEPYAILVRENTFEKNSNSLKTENKYTLEREHAIKIILEHMDKSAVIVSTTGKISRELYELRGRLGQSRSSDFLCVGSMGHASQIAMGIAINKPDKIIYCLDGDGAAIMHMGSMGIIGTSSCSNFRHIIINNGAHDSVGGQATAGFDIDFSHIAKGSGYKIALCAVTVEELIEKLNTLSKSDGPSLLEIRVRTGSRKDLGRPESSPEEIKNNFMEFLRK